MSNENLVKVGSVVISLAGRDKNRYYVAVSEHDGRVMIADGKKHKLSSPKLKNLKHISPVGEIDDPCDLTDKKLRRLIFAFKTQNAGEANNTVLKDG